jgi:hypothetical protein
VRKTNVKIIAAKITTKLPTTTRLMKSADERYSFLASSLLTKNGGAVESGMDPGTDIEGSGAEGPGAEGTGAGEGTEPPETGTGVGVALCLV